MNNVTFHPLLLNMRHKNTIVVFFICRNCKKKRITTFELRNSIFCNMKCLHKYMKKKNIGLYNFNVQSDGGKKGSLKCKKLRTGLYDKNIQLLGTSLGGKAGSLACKKRKLGAFFNPVINRKIRINILRNIRNIKFKNTYFDSKPELEIAMNLYYQFHSQLKEHVNCHVIVGGKEIDFFIHNTFIEVHPFDRYTTRITYRNARRKILDDNGYHNYKLLVIS